MKIWTPGQRSCFHPFMDIGHPPYSCPVDYTEEEERQATVNLFAGLLGDDDDS